MKISPKLLKEFLLLNARVIATLVVSYSVCLFLAAWLFHHPFDERRLREYSLIGAPMYSIFFTVGHYRKKQGKVASNTNF